MTHQPYSSQYHCSYIFHFRVSVYLRRMATWRTWRLWSDMHWIWHRRGWVTLEIICATSAQSHLSWSVWDSKNVRLCTSSSASTVTTWRSMVTRSGFTSDWQIWLRAILPKAHLDVHVKQGCALTQVENTSNWFSYQLVTWNAKFKNNNDHFSIFDSQSTTFVNDTRTSISRPILQNARRERGEGWVEKNDNFSPYRSSTNAHHKRHMLGMKKRIH